MVPLACVACCGVLECVGRKDENDMGGVHVVGSTDRTGQMICRPLGWRAAGFRSNRRSAEKTRLCPTCMHACPPSIRTYVLELGGVLGLLHAAQGEDEELGRVLLQPLHVRLQGLHLLWCGCRDWVGQWGDPMASLFRSSGVGPCATTKHKHARPRPPLTK
jgi:hypothetical protein